MKKIIFVFAMSLMCFAKCKKDNSSINITLHDKPLATIQSSITGKWDLKYEKGGITNGTYPQSNFIWTFTSDNKIIQSYHDTIVANTSMNWIRDKDIQGDSTYIMNFLDKSQVPFNYIVEGIYNDTLVLADNAFDGMGYFFTKSN